MNYRIGICAQLDRAPLLAAAGADHIEPGFGVVAGMDDATFADNITLLRESGLCVDSMNSMLPGTAILYGDEAQTEQLFGYVRHGMERAAILGCRNVVFGSGTARKIPEGWSLRDAQLRIATLLDRFCDIARPYGIRIAIEPLRAFETNFIHTIADAAEIIALLPHCDNLGINADIYHMLEGNEPFDALSHAGDRLYHVHICAPDRHIPRAERPESDHVLYRDFFRALHAANYEGTVSVEAIAKDWREDAPSALAIIRAAHDAADQN